MDNADDSSNLREGGEGQKSTYANAGQSWTWQEKEVTVAILIQFKMFPGYF